MKGFFKKTIGFLLLILISGFGVDYYLTNHFFKDWNRVTKADKNFWVLKQKDQHWEYAFLGTSRVFHTIMPKAVPEKKIINLGCDGTSHADHYLFLHQFITNGNKIDTLYLQVDEYTLSGLEDNTYPFKDFAFALKFNEEPFTATYKDCDWPKYYYWKIPMIRYFEFSNFYKIKLFYPEYSDVLGENRGFKPSKPRWEEVPNDHFARNCKVNEMDVKYVEKTIELAKENNIHVNLFTAPIHPIATKESKGREKSYQFLNELAKRHNIQYKNFSNTKELNDTIHFADGVHLSEIGAKKFTQLIIN